MDDGTRLTLVLPLPLDTLIVGLLEAHGLEESAPKGQSHLRSHSPADMLGEMMLDAASDESPILGPTHLPNDSGLALLDIHIDRIDPHVPDHVRRINERPLPVRQPAIRHIVKGSHCPLSRIRSGNMRSASLKMRDRQRIKRGQTSNRPDSWRLRPTKSHLVAEKMQNQSP